MVSVFAYLFAVEGCLDETAEAFIGNALKKRGAKLNPIQGDTDGLIDLFNRNVNRCNYKPILDFTGEMCLISKPPCAILCSDGLVHLNRQQLGVYEYMGDVGEEAHAEILQIPGVEVDLEGSITMTAEGRRIRGRLRVEYHAVLLVAESEQEEEHNWLKSIIKLRDQEPTVMGEEDLREQGRWLLRTEAHKRCKVIPEETLEAMVEKGVAKIKAVAHQKPFDLDDPEMQAFIRAKQKQTGKVGRNERCPCGSGKKFKHCCLLRN
jgi:hypothetical protein